MIGPDCDSLSFAMSSLDVLTLFRQSGALLEGHFKLSSGLHSPGYLQCALVLQHPAHAETLGRALAARLRALGATVVLSPAMGGLIIGHEVGRALGVRAIFAERVDGAMTLRRGFTLSPSDRVVVIEDVVTTGLSTRETIAVVAAAGATIAGAGAIIDRSGGTADLGVPFFALERLAFPTYQPDACPLCAAGQAVTKPGSRQ
jgi:orotate phosphoribosyltransferase